MSLRRDIILWEKDNNKVKSDKYGIGNYPTISISELSSKTGNCTAVVELHHGANDEKNLWIEHGVLKKDGIEWKKEESNFERGYLSSVASNNEGIIIAAYGGRSSKNVTLRSGFIDIKRNNIEWLESYDGKWYEKISINVGSKRDIKGRAKLIAMSNFNKKGKAYVIIANGDSEITNEVIFKCGTINIKKNDGKKDGIEYSWYKDTFNISSAGAKPSICISENGWVVVAYESRHRDGGSRYTGAGPYKNTGKIYCHLGHIDKGKLCFIHKYELGVGHAPQVCFSGNTYNEIVLTFHVKTSQSFYHFGELNEEEERIDWTSWTNNYNQKTGVPISDNKVASISSSDNGAVVFVTQKGKDRLYSRGTIHGDVKNENHVGISSEGSDKNQSILKETVEGMLTIASISPEGDNIKKVYDGVDTIVTAAFANSGGSREFMTELLDAKDVESIVNDVIRRVVNEAFKKEAAKNASITICNVYDEFRRYYKKYRNFKPGETFNTQDSQSIINFFNLHSAAGDFLNALSTISGEDVRIYGLSSLIIGISLDIIIKKYRIHTSFMESGAEYIKSDLDNLKNTIINHRKTLNSTIIDLENFKKESQEGYIKRRSNQIAEHIDNQYCGGEGFLEELKEFIKKNMNDTRLEKLSEVFATTTILLCFIV